jgi:alpha-tubulin suppressor-like RCC1 family protein
MYEPIKYIASGEEHNLCVFESGTVYGFGKNNQSKINSNKKESVFFERVDSDERARLIGCGANHSVMINLKGIPFTWGNTLNGRCGLKLESEDMKKKQESISNPTVVYSLKVLFNAEIIKMKERLGEVREKLNKSYNI